MNVYACMWSVFSVLLTSSCSLSLLFICYATLFYTATRRVQFVLLAVRLKWVRTAYELPISCWLSFPILYSHISTKCCCFLYFLSYVSHQFLFYYYFHFYICCCCCCSLFFSCVYSLHLQLQFTSFACFVVPPPCHPATQRRCWAVIEICGYINICHFLVFYCFCQVIKNFLKSHEKFIALQFYNLIALFNM